MKTREYIREKFSHYRIEIFIFLAVFGVRFAYSLLALIWFGSDSFVSYLDAEVFVREAKNILEHGVMSRFPEAPFLPDPLRTPLYLWFLAGLLWAGVSFFGIATVQNIMAGVMGVLLYRIGVMHLRAPRAGVLAAALFAVEPMSVYWNNLLMSDNLFAFLLVLTVYLFLEKRWYLGAASLGLATLARPVGLYFFPVFLLFAALHLFALNKNLRPLPARAPVPGTAGSREVPPSGFLERRGLRKTVGDGFTTLFLMAVIFALTIFPWMLRNKVLFNTWELSSAGWVNLYVFTVGEFISRQNRQISLPVVPEEYHPGSYKADFFNFEFESARFFKAQALAVIAEHPFAYARFHLLSGIQGVHNHDYRYLVDHVIRAKFSGFDKTIGDYLVWLGQGFWWVLYAGVILGFFQKGRRYPQLLVVTLLLLNALLIGYNGLISGGGRYNLPFVPFMLLLGTYGLVESYKWVRRGTVVSHS